MYCKDLIFLNGLYYLKTSQFCMFIIITAMFAISFVPVFFLLKIYSFHRIYSDYGPPLPSSFHIFFKSLKHIINLY